MSVDWWSVLQLGVGIVAGGFLNWLFALRSSRELRREAERLRRQTTLILRAMEEAGLAQLNKDENGEPLGLIINLSAVSTGRSSASGTLTEAGEDPEE